MIIHQQHISNLPVYSRIVSLVPSQTELLYDLGLDEKVKAITKFCVHPTAWHKNKVRIGGTKTVKIDLIKKIKPDLIIANKEENVKEQVEELANHFDVFVTDVNNLTDALEMIKNIGILTGTQAKANNLANDISTQFQKLQESFSSIKKLKTIYLIWKDPYIAVGNNTFIHDMMQYGGFENYMAHELRYPEIKLEDINERCELIILSSEPYPFKEKHCKQIRLQFPHMKVILADGEMFSWYGSRLLQAPHYFEILHKNAALIK